MSGIRDTRPKHFQLSFDGDVAVVRLDRPERKNPLTFDSYAELRDWFRDLHYAEDVGAVVFASNGGNFCSGGDVHDIIGPLTKMSMKELLTFTRMTGDLVKAMVNCGKPIIAAIDGVCAGAGAIISMASDLRIATPESLKFLPRIVFVAREIRHLAKLNGHNFSEIKKVALAWLRDARSGLFVRKEITPEPVKESKQMFWNLYLEDLKRLYPLMYITEVLNRSINPSLN